MVEGIGYVFHPVAGVGLVHPRGSGATQEFRDSLVGIHRHQGQVPVGPLHEQHHLGLWISSPFGLQVSGAKREVDGGLSSQSSTGLEKTTVRRPRPLRPLAVDEKMMKRWLAIGEFRKANLPEALTSRRLFPTGDATATAHHSLAGDCGPQRDSRMGRADF